MGKEVTLTIMGCGTSTGVPVPSCRCPVCSSRHPKNMRLRCSALIQSASGKNIIIDTGPDFRQQVLTYQVQHIDAVLFTHAHADHIMGFDDLRSFNFTMKKPVACYATDDTFETLRSIFTYIFEPNPAYQGGMLTSVALHPVTHGVALEFDDVRIVPFSLFHGETEITGYRVGSIAYATDCSHVPEKSFPILEGVEHLVLDGLRHRPHPTHFTIADAIQCSKNLKVGHTYLTHMSHDIDIISEGEKLPDGVSFCYDGLCISGHLD